jgi:hypothetical protein
MGLGISLAQAFEGESFCVVNRIYVGEEKKPQVTSTTIFLADMVYDFLDSPAEVTVFDKGQRRFVLLDLTRRVKTELTTARVASLAERIQAWARTQSDPYLRFLADPKFEQQYDAEAGQLALASDWMTYRVSTVPAPSEALSHQYREFSDWYSRLNTTLNPGSRPPFARLQLNAALDTHGRFPLEVVLTMRPKAGPLAKRITVRSEHQLTRGLAETDRGRIAQTDQFMDIFTPVTFKQYQDRMAD